MPVIVWREKLTPYGTGMPLSMALPVHSLLPLNTHSMAREINSMWDRHGTVYGTTQCTGVCVCRGTSVETRLSVPDFVSALVEIKSRTESLY